jgi:hypothetical protein
MMTATTLVSASCRDRPGRLFALAVALSLVGPLAWAPAAAPETAAPTRAAVTAGPERPAPVVPLAANGWSIKRFFGGLNNRTRVVQLCVVVMALALFIMMRKLAQPPPPAPPAGPESPPPTGGAAADRKE